VWVPETYRCSHRGILLDHSISSDIREAAEYSPVAGTRDTSNEASESRSRRACDAALLVDIAEGNLAGLGILFDRYESIVRRFIGRLGLRHAEADDIVQLTFLDVPHAARSFDGARSARRWLLGLAAIQVRRHRRSTARMAEILLTWAREPVRGAPTPAETFEILEGTARIERALSRVSPKKREVFDMIVLQDSTSEEVARVLGIPVATVWTRLHYARREVREHLAREAGDA
jgi:RNA polymerase sigma factor (sigma-70 family)